MVKQIHMPDEKSWAAIKRDCKLNAEQAVALWATLEKAVALSEAQSRGPTIAEMKKALTKLDNTLARLSLILNGKDVTDALRVIETYGQMGHLLSATATVQLSNCEGELSEIDIERLVQRKQLRREPINPSEIDSLAIPERQRRLNSQTPEAMDFVVRQLRQPITAWLLQARQDKGGNRLNNDRELIIFLLSRDASKFIEQKPKTFINLCSRVLIACGIDDQGIEDAITRCLKKYRGWLSWSKSPKHKLEIQALSDDQLQAIENNEDGILS